MLMRMASFALWMAVFLAALHGQTSDKTIFVSVLDTAGRSVLGVTAPDLAVREDGVEREIVSMGPATEPLRIALLADTTGGSERHLQTVRAGLVAFIRDVLAASPQSEISLWEFGLASQQIRDFTGDGAALEKDVLRLIPRPNAGSVLLETVYDASEALARRPSQRRAIVVLNLVPSAELSEQQPKAINDSLMRSRAQLWALSLQNGALQDPQRDSLLETLVRNAGGARDVTLSEAAVERYMRQYAAALAAQYALTYRRPAGGAQIVQTGIRHDRIKVVAGLFAPK